MTATTSPIDHHGAAEPGCVPSDPPGSETPPTAPERRRTALALRWVLPALALVFLVRTLRSGWDHFGSALQAFEGKGAVLVVCALAIEVAWTLSLSQVYRSSIIAFGGSTTRRQALRVSMSAFTLSRILPGGGAVGALFAAREFVRVGNSSPITLLALITAGWASLTTLALLVSVGIAVGCLTRSLAPSMLVVPIATWLALTLAGIAAARSLRSPGWRRRVFDLIERVFSRWSPGMRRSDLEFALSRTSGSRQWHLASVGWWATLSWVLDATALWLVFAAFDQRLDLGSLAVGYGAANLIQALPEVTPGWLGVIEGTLAVVYTGLGVPVGPALLAVLGYRLVSFWIPVAAGIPAALGTLRAFGPAQQGRSDR